jgi:phosphopantothenoylcysteine decarboxylase/phosphopantothenate--cysteine ligase
LQLLETPDIVATLGAGKRPTQWIVGFALETTDQRIRAQLKLEKKSCDLIVLNGPQAIDSETNVVEVMNRRGQIVRQIDGSKALVARGIFDIVQNQLIDRLTT